MGVITLSAIKSNPPIRKSARLGEGLRFSPMRIFGMPENGANAPPRRTEGRRLSDELHGDCRERPDVRAGI